MNFLSHYYFDRASEDPYLIVGIILPDLLKTASGTGNLNPLKIKSEFSGEQEFSILQGWERHVMVDKIFHTSVPFRTETARLKQLILPLLDMSPVKPFFLAHIGFELILDHLLTINHVVSIHKFYELLSTTRREVIANFLYKCDYQETDQFFSFFDSFIKSKYLHSYSEIDHITYALNRICMRLWPSPMSEAQQRMLTEQLGIFLLPLQDSFYLVFDEIAGQLDPGPL